MARQSWPVGVAPGDSGVSHDERAEGPCRKTVPIRDGATKVACRDRQRCGQRRSARKSIPLVAAD